MKWFLAFIPVFLLSCEKNENKNCVSYEPGRPISINGPSTGKVGDDINLTVEFAVMNGCGQFERFEESDAGHQKVISIVAKYSGCACTDNIPILTAEYVYKPTSSGIHYLKFESATTPPVVDTLVISQ